MFTEPISLTYNAVAKSLPRTDSGEDGSEYRLTDSSGVVYSLKLSHQFAKRTRVVVRLQRDANVADPLVPANYLLASMTAQFTIDFPGFGLTPTDATYLANCLVGFLTGANVTKLCNGET